MSDSSADLAVIERPSLDDLTGAIGAALCTQAEAAEASGSEIWWGMSTDFVAGIAAEGVSKLLDAAEGVSRDGE